MMRNNILAAIYVLAVAVVFSGAVNAQNCGPCQKDSDCGNGNSCCYTQYSNGTISCNFCKSGSCYTTNTKKLLNNVKELDAIKFRQEKLPNTGETKTSETKNGETKADETKTSEMNAQNCGSCQKDADCGNGNSCCYHQYPNGSISCNYCKTGSCYTTNSKKLLNRAQELNTSGLKEQGPHKNDGKTPNPPKSDGKAANPQKSDN